MRVIRFKAEGSKSKNVKELANLKKQIAKVLTEINTKNIK
jgi:ribosomal protein L29